MKRMVSRPFTRWRGREESKEGGRRKNPEKEMKVRKETERSSMQVWSKERKKKEEGGQVEVFFFLFSFFGRWQWGQEKMVMRLEYFWPESLESLKNLF